ncbi:hypothetical protein CEXT_751981 [Caerostris extrusa]|uniref:Secreted protein n=1 Tax=Caerostris extrusa TaxID=172846 RepID=A0AAV4Y8D7_CAEEX|nr:hypothetical protein CEXT_751981 [Caerostris extrusa]
MMAVSFAVFLLLLPAAFSECCQGMSCEIESFSSFYRLQPTGVHQATSTVSLLEQNGFFGWSQKLVLIE